MWLHSPDPEFRVKLAEICALYVCLPTGSVVLCGDEKTGMQALGRPHPVRPAGPHRARRKDSGTATGSTSTTPWSMPPGSIR